MAFMLRNLPNEVKNELKHLAIDRGISLNRLIIDILIEYVSKIPKKIQMLG